MIITNHTKEQSREFLKQEELDVMTQNLQANDLYVNLGKNFMIN